MPRPVRHFAGLTDRLKHKSVYRIHDRRVVKLSMTCACAFCAGKGQLIGSPFRLPLAVLYHHTSDPATRYCAWWGADASVKSDHGEFESMHAAHSSGLTGWLVRVSATVADRSDSAVSLFALTSTDWGAASNRACPGALGKCICVLESEVHDWYFMRVPRSRKRTARCAPGTRKEARGEAHWMPKSAPFHEWSGGRLQEYFDTDDRIVEEDPLLDTIIKVNYHAIGLPLYTCVWMHPDGETMTSSHRAGALLSNPHYVRRMRAAEHRTPDSVQTEWDAYQ